MTDPASTIGPDLEAGTPPRRSLAALVVPLVGLALAGYLLFDRRAALGYWVGSQQPVELGGTGGYHLDRARDGVLANIEGVPGAAAVRFERLGTRYEVVAVRGTNILVRRERKGPALTRRSGEREPPPAAVPFQASGRLVLDTSAPEYYAQAFRHLVERGGAEPTGGHLYVLMDGERPREGWTVPLVVGGLVALIAVNLWGLSRSLRRS